MFRLALLQLPPSPIQDSYPDAYLWWRSCEKHISRQRKVGIIIVSFSYSGFSLISKTQRTLSLLLTGDFVFGIFFYFKFFSPRFLNLTALIDANFSRSPSIHKFTREVPCGLFWTEGNQDPTDSRKLFTSLHCLKEFKSGAARKRAISRDNFLAERLTYMAGHISALLIFLWSALLPFEASGPYIPLSECHTTLNYLTAFGFHIGAEGSVHIFYGNPIHTKFVFLLLLFLTLI